MAGDEVHHIDVMTGKPGSCMIQHQAGNALSAIGRLDIYCADIGRKIRALMEVIFDHAKPGDDFLLIIEDDIPCRYAVLCRQRIIHAVHICLKRHTPFAVKPLRRTFNQLRMLAKIDDRDHHVFSLFRPSFCIRNVLRRFSRLQFSCGTSSQWGSVKETPSSVTDRLSSGQPGQRASHGVSSI